MPDEPVPRGIRAGETSRRFYLAAVLYGAMGAACAFVIPFAYGMEHDNVRVIA